MSEWLDNQKKQTSNFRKLLQERIEKANPRRELTTDETKRLATLKGITDKLKRGENVQNRQLQTWLSEDEYAQIEAEWQEQLELREELKDKPSNLKRYDEKLREAGVVGLLLGNERVVSVIAGTQHIVEAFAHVEDRVQIREDAVHLRTASGTVNEWTREPAEAQASLCAPSRLHPSCPRGA